MPLTKINDYTPTTAEKKLIEVLSNPNSLGKSVTAICKEAGISRPTYYEILKKPGFNAYYNSLILEILQSKVGEVLNATYQYAVSNPKNHQDRKLLLEMTGLHVDALNLSGEMNFAVAMPAAVQQQQAKQIREAREDYDADAGE